MLAILLRCFPPPVVQTGTPLTWPAYQAVVHVASHRSRPSAVLRGALGWLGFGHSSPTSAFFVPTYRVAFRHSLPVFQTSKPPLLFRFKGKKWELQGLGSRQSLGLLHCYAPFRNQSLKQVGYSRLGVADWASTCNPGPHGRVKFPACADPTHPIVGDNPLDFIVSRRARMFRWRSRFIGRS